MTKKKMPEWLEKKRDKINPFNFKGKFSLPLQSNAYDFGFNACFEEMRGDIDWLLGQAHELIEVSHLEGAEYGEKWRELVKFAQKYSEGGDE